MANFYTYIGIMPLGQEGVGTSGRYIDRELKTIRGVVKKNLVRRKLTSFSVYQFTNFYDNSTFRLVYQRNGEEILEDKRLTPGNIEDSRVYLQGTRYLGGKELQLNDLEPGELIRVANHFHIKYLPNPHLHLTEAKEKIIMAIDEKALSSYIQELRPKPAAKPAE